MVIYRFMLFASLHHLFGIRGTSPASPDTHVDPECLVKRFDPDFDRLEIGLESICHSSHVRIFKAPIM